MSERPCPTCEGKRLRPEALAVTVDDVNIVEVTDWPVLRTLDWVKKLAGEETPLTARQQAIAERILKEIQSPAGLPGGRGAGLPDPAAARRPRSRAARRSASAWRRRSARA